MQTVDYFLHIPRTGGTTFTKILSSFYEPHEVLPYQTYTQLLEAWPVDFTGIKLICGHFGYSLRYLLGHDNIRYFTFLRNPLDRAVSVYNFVKAVRNKEWSLPFKRSKFLKLDSSLLHLFSNGLIKSLSVEIDLTSSIEKIRQFSKEIRYYVLHREFVDPTKDLMQLFEKAKENLKRFFFVGITEYFNDSIQKLCGLLNKPMPLHIMHLNKSRYKYIDLSLKHKLRSLNEMDLQLYDWALQNVFNV